ncbi:MAG: hypothetical protein FJ320_10995 [SAR202 cluster bacterium]|nr:hypothetical protein [SAR202 cluster bacterium]
MSTVNNTQGTKGLQSSRALSTTSPKAQVLIFIVVVAVFNFLILCLGPEKLNEKQTVVLAIVLLYTALGWGFRTVAERSNI